ncbi:enoyl-CoA hydratase/isomerase family protein [Pseudoroseomonas cervicalis]|uniref:enoyl-CoA hydratase/isomerase family protein n=1 Tax=Teichococcus cervicalis TaxID=204525 RepID=UPI0022F153EF|nr:enoyl-CoA hydratase/isomerase family protein [Pseudoroseomonas cervicalis]WBV44345.1 enoyl-CoA hydratase/isomerase family protein [Pseudoroseomonas cervicalis]
MSLRLQREEGGIALVTMDRPAKRNAFTLEMYQALGDFFSELDADDSVRCVVLAGAGGHFCAGSDIGDFDSNRDDVAQARDYADFTLSMTDRLKFCRHPTIAAIEGVCVGGGLEMAALCDLRLGAAGSRYGIPINRIAMTVDHRELVDLIEVIGHRATLEILVEGRIFGPEEALAKGLLTRILPEGGALDAALEAARRIAGTAPLSNRLHKKFIRRLRDPAPLTEAERDEAYACFGTEDYRIGRAAFLRKERPGFVGR